jgi:hypothetical protein
VPRESTANARLGRNFHPIYIHTWASVKLLSGCILRLSQSPETPFKNNFLMSWWADSIGKKYPRGNSNLKHTKRCFLFPKAQNFDKSNQSFVLKRFRANLCDKKIIFFFLIPLAQDSANVRRGWWFSSLWKSSLRPSRGLAIINGR